MESVRRHTPKAVLNSISWLRRQLPNLDPLELLPLGFDVLKGAIVIGNASTPNLLVSQFQKAEGTYGITEVCFIPNAQKHAHTRNCSQSRYMIITKARSI